jgi:phage protein D
LKISSDLSNYAPEFEIFVNKQAIPDGDMRKSAVSISINEKIAEVGEYTLVLSDKLDILKQEFQWLDNPVLEVGNDLRIDLGYAISKLEKIIEGPIKAVSTSGFTSEIPKLTVVGYDKSHQFLTQKSTSEGYPNPDKNDTFSDIAEKVAGEAGLDFLVHKTKVYWPLIIKKPETYRDFLVDAAKRVGYEFFISRNKLYFVNPVDLEKSASEMTFEWGKNLMQFTPIINASELVTGVEVRGLLPDSEEVVSETASYDDDEISSEKWVVAGEIARKLNNGKDNIKTIGDRSFSSREEAKDMAKAELERLSNTLVTGSCTIIGNPLIITGMTVELKNVGRRFSGIYYVTGVTNTIDSNGYITTFDVRRSFIG